MKEARTKLTLVLLILTVIGICTYMQRTEKPVSSMSMSDLAVMIILFTFLMPKQNKD